MSEASGEEIDQGQIPTIKVGRRVRKSFGRAGYFDGLVVEVDVADDGSNETLYVVKYEDGDGEDLFWDELQPILVEKLSASKEATEVAKIRAKISAGPINDAVVAHQTTNNTVSKRPKPKKKRKSKHTEMPRGNVALFLLDCETTGSRRNYDRAVEWCVMAYDKDGQLKGEFTRRVNPGAVPVSYHAFKVHGISDKDLEKEDDFSVVGADLNEFFTTHLQDCDVGVLVAHNTSTDLQFLCCEYIRAGLTLPAKIKYGLCTYQTLKRLKSVYRTADDSDWTETTATGARCYSVKCCAQYALSRRTPPAEFEIACGRHHEATADVKAVAVILFDKDVFSTNGLWDIVFHKRRKVCQLLADVHSAMVTKMSTPVIDMLPAPSGWIDAPAEHDDSPLSASSTALPPGVREHTTSKFKVPRRARGEGQATDFLLRFLGMLPRTCQTKIPHTKLMVELFMFFFTEELLLKIVHYTNAKAKELVPKVTKTNAHGFTWKVQHPDGIPEQRCKGWHHDLTVGELLVYIGIMFKMGAIGHKRVKHYWSKRKGFGVDGIRDCMTLKRFEQITAHLSFAPLNSDSGWAKISEVDEYLQARCILAMTITQMMTVDESMMKCLSKWCPWIVYMPRKPIKMGIKVHMHTHTHTHTHSHLTHHIFTSPCTHRSFVWC